ncbi:unnamed protein product, partial [Meganyctiphanes norvegica]
MNSESRPYFVKKLRGLTTIPVIVLLQLQFKIPYEDPKSFYKGDENSTTDGPPTKKQRTGQNKKRPKMIKLPRSSKLCRSVWDVREDQDPASLCTFPNCDFSHDLDAYLAVKPDSLGELCHNYETYGLCQYGITCRYSNEHLEKGRNKVNEEKWSHFEKNPPVINILKKDVQQLLRRKKYNFDQSLEADKKAKAIVGNRRNTDGSARVDEDKDDSVADENKSQNGTIKDSMNGSANESNSLTSEDKPVGPALSDHIDKREKGKIDWKGKLYLAPLTTLGNLPYRRICKRLGADITCSEMALSTSFLQGNFSEWALVKRHESEDLFGIQVCGSNSEAMIKCTQLLKENVEFDFVDINMGCPIDLIYKQGGGSALMRRTGALENMVLGMTDILDKPLTLKMRTSIHNNKEIAHKLIEKAKLWDIDMITVHGRSREQRYTKDADWNYINMCAGVADPIPLFGNGDIFTYEDYKKRMETTKIAGAMFARGALIKPWIFTEIKEQREWDISSEERFNILKEFANNGMEHWGSDTEGIEKTRRYMLEWLSFLYRYIPVGLLDQPQGINQRPPKYFGRNDLETKMASGNAKDWVEISSMILGPPADDFEFLPKHKANSWA